MILKTEQFGLLSRCHGLAYHHMNRSDKQRINWLRKKGLAVISDLGYVQRTVLGLESIVATREWLKFNGTGGGEKGAEE